MIKKKKNYIKHTINMREYKNDLQQDKEFGVTRL